MMDDEPQDDVDWLVRALVNAERLLAGHWADPASLSPPEITMLCKIEDLLDQLEEKTNYELTVARPELPKCGGEDSR